MGKRFTDTDKWKKPFIRGLQGPYKLLWFYILDDCDHAGIWHVDFEVAQIRIGHDLDIEWALEQFGDRVQVLEGHKWFIPDFIKFQYGELNEKNRAHASVLSILKKYKVHERPLQGAKDKDKEMDKEKDKEKDKDKDSELLEDYELWTQQITDGNDHEFEVMFMNEQIPQSPNIQFWIMDHRDLLNRYPKMRPPNQNAFRKSCLKHIRENYKKPTNGKSNSFNDSISRLNKIVDDKYGPGGTG